MDSSQLDELERLHAAATPGPWFCKSVPGLGGGRHNRPHIFADGICLPVASLSVIKGEEDAAYITAACNAVPGLIARVRELERQRDWLATEFSRAFAGIIPPERHIELAEQAVKEAGE